MGNCKGCDYLKTNNHWEDDGWLDIFDWWCKKTTPNKKIMGAVEQHEESNIKIPNWCPLGIYIKVKNKDKRHFKNNI